MAPRPASRSFSGSVYSLISAGDEGQEILHIRAVDGDGDRVDLEFDVCNGKVLAESLKLKVGANRKFVLKTDAQDRVQAALESAAV